MAEGVTAITWLAVFLGGGVGSVLRFALGQGMRAAEVGGFPWAVLAANVLATALLAWCAVAGAELLGPNLPHLVLHDGRGVWRVQHVFDVCLGHLAPLGRRWMGVGGDQRRRLRGGMRGGQLVGGPNHLRGTLRRC